MQNKAVYSLLITIGYSITRRLRFMKDHIGEIITSEDGEPYTVFRKVTVNSGRKQNNRPGAILVIRFNFAHGSPRQNRLLSLIPIPFITGMPGFISKMWSSRNDNGAFQGIYEWESVQDAENYIKSFAVKLMTKRAVPGSVIMRIIPQ